MNRFRSSIASFRANPASARNATVAIISVTIAVVMVGASLVRIFDHEEYPTFGRALWFTLQTVTTVGYGDATPSRVIGRVVAAFVMLTAIGLVSVVTAYITAEFVEAARAGQTRSRDAEDSDALARLESSLDAISERLDRLETTLQSNRQDPEGRVSKHG